MKCLILCLTFLLFSSLTVAAPSAPVKGGSNIYVDFGLFPVYVSRNDTSSVTAAPGVATESGLGVDTHSTLGYVFSSQIFFGLTYNYYKLTTSRGNVLGGDAGLDETTTTSSYGPTLGYLTHGWSFFLTYLMSGDKSVDTKNTDSSGVTGNVTITNNKLTGVQFSVGCNVPISPNFEIMPSLVLTSGTYETQSKTNRLNNSAIENYKDVSLYSKSMQSTLNPMMSLIFKF